MVSGSSVDLRDVKRSQERVLSPSPMSKGPAASLPKGAAGFGSKLRKQPRLAALLMSNFLASQQCSDENTPQLNQNTKRSEETKG